MLSQLITRKWIITTSALALLMMVCYWYWPPRQSYNEHKDSFPAAYQELDLQSAWCQGFIEKNERLPSPEELQKHFGTISWIYGEQPEWSDTWGVPGRDFILTATVGEWNLFLQSWDKKYFEKYNEW